MFNRRNAFIGWAVLQVAKRKLRRHGRSGSGLLRGAGRLAAGAVAAGAVAVAARRLLGRRRSDGTGGPGPA